MLKNISLVMMAIVLVFTSSVVMAQGMAGAPKKHDKMPFGKWWQNPASAENLNLNEGEIEALDAAFDNRARKFMELKHAIELEQFEMNRMMESKTLDEAALMTQFGKLESARANLSMERFQYYVEIRKILGPDRFQKIKSFRQKMYKQKKGNKKKKKESRQ